MIDVSVPPLATQTIFEAYLQVLEDANQRDLIALYAGALGDNAIERYALFLVSLELSADSNERRLTLTRAREHGLDVDRVAVVAAERTIERAFEVSGCSAVWYAAFHHRNAAPSNGCGDIPVKVDRMDHILGCDVRYSARAGQCHSTLFLGYATHYPPVCFYR